MDFLIVEDEPLTRRLLKTYLEKMGHCVQEAQNGKQGIDILNRHPVHFIITDWLMPEMDGLEFCRYIRNTNWGWYVYIIVLTAKGEKKDLLTVFQAGADDFIPKPFDYDELTARINTGLRIVTFEDHHLEMQTKLLESRNKLQTVFDALQEWILTIDTDLNVSSVNQSFASTMKLDKKDIIGRPGSEICPKPVMEKVNQVFSSGKKVNFLINPFDENGADYYHEVVCLPVFYQTSEVQSVIIVAKDITERQRKTKQIETLNQQLLQTAEQVQTKNTTLEQTLKRLEDTQSQMIQSEKMASIGQLAAGVAHEINNPTGFVSSNLNTLSDYCRSMSELIEKYHAMKGHVIHSAQSEGTTGSEIAEIAENISNFEQAIDIDFLLTDVSDLISDCREGTERIKKIVSDLKDFAHPGNEERQLVDLNKGLESTLNVVNNEIKYKASVHKSFGDIPIILGFPQQLNQVFMNILVNAAQAIEDKGDIFITTKAENGWVDISIADSGCGINNENLTKIFDPFFTTKDVGKGTGLGMHIAYNIVAKHQGTIEVKSKVGEGTEFIIKLPVTPEEEKKAG